MHDHDETKRLCERLDQNRMTPADKRAELASSVVIWVLMVACAAVAVYRILTIVSCPCKW
jgi:hypothetical protein